MMSMSIKDDFAFVQNFFTVGAYPIDGQDTVNSGAAFGPGMHQISIAVIVPKRAGIDPAFGFSHMDQRFPGAGGVLSLGHEDAPVRVTKVNKVFAIVIPNAGRPNTVAVLRAAKSLIR